MKPFQSTPNQFLTVFILLLIIVNVINVKYLRPAYGDRYILGNILGSMPNFIGSYIFFVLLSDIWFKRHDKNNELFLLIIGSITFCFLTIEEFSPFFLGSKTFDIFDIIANAIGVVIAYYSVKHFLVKYNKLNI